MTDSVAFEVTERRWPDHPELLHFQIVPFVNGLSLIDILSDFERPLAEAEGHPDIAGSYEGLRGSAAGRRRHYLAEPVEVWFDDGDTVLLACSGCGEWGCWPFTVDVTLGDDTVRWTNFRLGHRDWDYSALGEWTFDRKEYEAALEAIPLIEAQSS